MCGDDDGRYLGSSSLVIRGIINVATLEAMTCGEALALAEDLMIQNVIIASDSKQVVNGIERGSSSTYGCIISEIKQQASLINHRFTFEGGHQTPMQIVWLSFQTLLISGDIYGSCIPMLFFVYHFM